MRDELMGLLLMVLTVAFIFIATFQAIAWVGSW